MKRIILSAAAMFLVVIAADARAQVVRVSVATDGTQGNATSQSASVSRDGRYVAFASGANNLVAGDTNAGIFVRDRVANVTSRVSVAAPGGQEAGTNNEPSISADGRYVAFTSTAPLVAGDTNVCGFESCRDVYVRDREIGETSLVSVASLGVSGNDHSFGARISADGRYVAFLSQARNLVGNAAPNPDQPFEVDAFLYDRVSGSRWRVSRSGQGSGDLVRSSRVRLTDDGLTVAFMTEIVMTSFDAEEGAACGHTLPCTLTYVYTVGEGPARPIVLGDLPPEKPGLTVTDTLADISGDGRYLLFQRVMGPTYGNGEIGARILLHDRSTGRTAIIASAEQFFRGLAIGGDGRQVAYIRPPNLNDPPIAHAVVFDRVTGREHAAAPSVGFTFTSLDDLSGDGRVAAFTSDHAIAPDDTNQFQDVFTFDVDLDREPLAYARYFAEGASNAFFRTRIAIVNPLETDVSVQARFLGASGGTTGVFRTIAAKMQTTIDLGLGADLPSSDFSTVIESTGPIVADRYMTWDATGFGASAETAIDAPSNTWLLAEGATHGAFDLFYLLQNPNTIDTNVTVTYLRPAPIAPVVRSYAVAANSRRTIWVDAEGPELAATDVAAAISADRPVVVERAMYYSTPTQPFAAGHVGAGVPAAATTWYLAEGATGSFFDLYLLVANPGTDVAQVRVSYLLPSGERFGKSYTVAGQSRRTISVADEDPRVASTSVSMIVESTNGTPIVAERAMWWPKGQWYEGHLSAGATATGARWAFAGGMVDAHTETYILIANTSATASTATLTLLPEGGSPIVQTLDVAANARVTVAASTLLPSGASARFGALVDSPGAELVVEHVSYTTVGDVPWAAGAASLATKLP